MPVFNLKLKPLAAILTIAATSVVTTGCIELNDNGDGSNTQKTYTASSENYHFEYISNDDLNGGVNNYTLKVSAKDGSDLEGETVSSVPVMDMVSGIKHSTPTASLSGNLDSEGNFTTTAYFLMPSINPSNNEKLGDWYLNVEFDGESANIPFDVSWEEGSRGNLFGGDDDQIKDMSGKDTDRNYFIYFEGAHHMDNLHTFSVYVSARESMMDYKPVIQGMALSKGGTMGMSMNMMSMANEEDLIVNSVNVEICLEACDNSANFYTAEASTQKDGVYSISVADHPSDLSTLHVTVSVNGHKKTNVSRTSDIATVTLVADSMSNHSHAM